MRMKVVLIAGGKGTRGKPFTDHTPKPMIPIKGRPMIDHIVRFLSKFYCIGEILIVCENDSHGKQIFNYFEGMESVIRKKITFVADKKNGTGGSLLLCNTYLESEPYFLVWYSDNLCAVEIRHLEKKFLSIISEEINNVLICMVVSRSIMMEETGRISIKKRYVDNLHPISKFIEKPLIKSDDHQAAGIYMFNNFILKELSKFSNRHQTIVFDIASDILSNIEDEDRSSLYSYDLSEKGVKWADIESPTYIERYHPYIDSIIDQMEDMSEKAV